MSVQTPIEAFVAAASSAYHSHVQDAEGRRSIKQIFAGLEGALEPRDTPGKRLPVCRYLDDTCVPDAFADPSLHALMAAFRAMEPQLNWYLRGGDQTGANEAYATGHANAMIIGPGGLVRHKSVWLGVSLLAPAVRYPDHRHPPEETYLVLSEGAFYQEGRGWFTPGIGGTFYNPPGILHAMRSGQTPLFAMWALRAT
ncbi:dimethylsulfonioproprionate lyase family protein [Roseovarius sp. 2305UL8-3]|uniref:dimethylsulfonioproprionate lyase family protein n=1 Tax=Roseovarius conchicola TaxID=3121636 RepID=UPI003529BDE0